MVANYYGVKYLTCDHDCRQITNKLKFCNPLKWKIDFSFFDPHPSTTVHFEKILFKFLTPLDHCAQWLCIICVIDGGKLLWCKISHLWSWLPTNNSQLKRNLWAKLRVSYHLRRLHLWFFASWHTNNRVLWSEQGAFINCVEKYGGQGKILGTASLEQRVVWDFFWEIFGRVFDRDFGEDFLWGFFFCCF